MLASLLYSFNGCNRTSVCDRQRTTAYTVPHSVCLLHIACASRGKKLPLIQSYVMWLIIRRNRQSNRIYTHSPTNES